VIQIQRRTKTFLLYLKGPGGTTFSGEAFPSKEKDGDNCRSTGVVFEVVWGS
jgi:hypothetical protein